MNDLKQTEACCTNELQTGFLRDPVDLLVNHTGGWSDSVAVDGILRAGYGNPQNRDRVTIIGGIDSPVSKFYDGTYPNGSWNTPAVYINGNMVVDGTLSADGIAGGCLTEKQKELLHAAAEALDDLGAPMNARDLREIAGDMK